LAFKPRLAKDVKDQQSPRSESLLATVDDVTSLRKADGSYGAIGEEDEVLVCGEGEGSQISQKVGNIQARVVCFAAGIF
jgi:hypothetical protein